MSSIGAGRAMMRSSFGRRRRCGRMLRQIGTGWKPLVAWQRLAWLFLLPGQVLQPEVVTVYMLFKLLYA